MDTQDHTTHSGDDGHGVHLCHRCGWPFPNPHPSAKHRRAHKKICGTIEGYTVLIGSHVVSDDEHEHHSDDDTEHTPSPKTGEIKESVSRSEDEFADAATEFVDTGSAKKTLEKDLFFSFKDAENAEINKVDTITEVSEKTEETEIKPVGDSSESNPRLTETSDVVKDGVVAPAPEPTHVSKLQEAGEENGQESQTPDTITEEAKDSEAAKTTPEASAIVEETNDDIKQEIKSDCEHVSEVAKESEIVEEIKTEKTESDHNHVAEVAKESESAETVSDLTEKVDLGEPKEHIQEVVKESVAVLTESKDLEAPELEKSSIEQIQEAVSEPAAVLIEKEDLGGPQLEKQSIEHTHDVVEKPESIVTEKDVCIPELEESSKEHIKEVVKETDTVLTEKEDLGGPHLEKQSSEHTHEVVEKPDSTLTEKQEVGAPESIVEKPDSVLNEKEDLGAHELEKCSKDEVIEQEVNNDRIVAADVSTETVTLKDSSADSVTNIKDASCVVPKPIVEGNGKLVNNQDPGADVTVDSSSHNSLEGTWGSVSVLSTASTDAETLQSTEKSKVNSGKSDAAISDAFETLQSTEKSNVTPVEPESKTSEVQDESEGKKKNEEVVSDVTNLSTGKQSTPLKNLLGEARSPSGKQPEPVVQKEEAAVNPSVNDEASSPPKLIEDGKKVKKKSRSSWVPFVCCSSVNAVK
ncbi:uncharacterized protein LOC143604975 isoform X2 [Bidens hawaiensis]|uniref:uncharacterized protein LOC143604975 isoform X2 n=1 Tax=Bidens hawaiensis TaxID=980011 RepID=UPI00404A7C96